MLHLHITRTIAAMFLHDIHQIHALLSIFSEKIVSTARVINSFLFLNGHPDLLNHRVEIRCRGCASTATHQQ